MIEIVLFVMAVAGLTNVLVQGKIFNWPRNQLKKFLPSNLYSGLECHECTGFWAGLLCGYCLISNAPFDVLMCGFAGSMIGNYSSLVAMLIESKIDFVMSGDPSEETNSH